MNVTPSVWRIFQEAELGLGFETMFYQRIKANISPVGGGGGGGGEGRGEKSEKEQYVWI